MLIWQQISLHLPLVCYCLSLRTLFCLCSESILATPAQDSLLLVKDVDPDTYDLNKTLVKYPLVR